MSLLVRCRVWIIANDTNLCSLQIRLEQERKEKKKQKEKVCLCVCVCVYVCVFVLAWPGLELLGLRISI